MEKNFYIYTLAYPGGRVFYVGKGKNSRVTHHEREAKSGHLCHKCNTIRKIWLDGQQVKIEKIFQTANEQEAFEFERQTIARYGRENLTNLTDGGDGSSGWNPPRKWRENHSIYMSKRNKGNKIWLGKKHKPETRKKMSDNNAMRNPEYRKRVSAGLMGRFVSEETRRKIGNANRGRVHSEESRKRMSVSQNKRYKENPVSDETRKKLSDGLRGRTYSKETIERMKVAARKRMKSFPIKFTDEVRRKISDAAKRRWARQAEQAR